MATARVTTFSFPLFILSGAPPGRLLSQRASFSAALGASESHTWKIALPGGSVSVARFPFGLPRGGVRGKAYHKHDFASSSFLRKSLRFFHHPALTYTKSSMLEQKNNFYRVLTMAKICHGMLFALVRNAEFLYVPRPIRHRSAEKPPALRLLIVDYQIVLPYQNTIFTPALPPASSN